jgi:hypothetical protein
MDGNLLENKEGPRECLGTEFSVHMDLRALDATNLTGTHTFEVRVRDFARNDAVERWTVDFASTPPATEIGHEDPYGDDEEPVVDEPPGAEVRQIGVSTHELEGDATTAAPSQARAAQTSPPARCGRDVTSQHPQDTFRIKFNGQGTSNGHRYYSYHLHYQVRQRSHSFSERGLPQRASSPMGPLTASSTTTATHGSREETGGCLGITMSDKRVLMV